jgi:hypothetical protein
MAAVADVKATAADRVVLLGDLLRAARAATLLVAVTRVVVAREAMVARSSRVAASNTRCCYWRLARSL